MSPAILRRPSHYQRGSIHADVNHCTMASQKIYTDRNPTLSKDTSDHVRPEFAHRSSKSEKTGENVTSSVDKSFYGSSRTKLLSASSDFDLSSGYASDASSESDNETIVDEFAEECHYIDDDFVPSQAVEEDSDRHDLEIERLIQQLAMPEGRVVKRTFCVDKSMVERLLREPSLPKSVEMFEKAYYDTKDFLLLRSGVVLHYDALENRWVTASAHKDEVSSRFLGKDKENIGIKPFATVHVQRIQLNISGISMTLEDKGLGFWTCLMQCQLAARESVCDALDKVHRLSNSLGMKSFAEIRQAGR